METKKYKIFICYSRKDHEYEDQLFKHLKGVEKKLGLDKDNPINLIISHDQAIQPAKKWNEEIATWIQEANLAICILSLDFFTSDYILEEELPRMEERKKKGEDLEIFSILLKSCIWERDKFLKDFQVFPSKSEERPIIKENDKSMVGDQLVKAANTIETMIKEFVASQQPNNDVSPPNSDNQLQTIHSAKLVKKFQNGQITPFLGPGRYYHKNKEKSHTTLLDLASLIRERINNPEEEDPCDSLNLLAQKYVNLIDNPNKAGLKDIINSLYQKPPSTPTHSFLAQIEGPLLIVSTAYDILLEEACKRKEKKFSVITHFFQTKKLLGWRIQTYDEKGEAGDPLITGQDECKTNDIESAIINKLEEKQTVIYKISGIFPHFFPTLGNSDSATPYSMALKGNYQVTEEDNMSFFKFLFSNNKIPLPLQNALFKNQLLFLDFYLNDWNSRAMLDLLSTQYSATKKHKERNSNTHDEEEHNAFAVQKDISGFENAYWLDKDVLPLKIEISDFTAQLAKAMGISL